MPPTATCGLDLVPSTTTPGVHADRAPDAGSPPRRAAASAGRSPKPVPGGPAPGAQALGVLAEVCTVGLTATAAWLIVRAAERPDFADLAWRPSRSAPSASARTSPRYAERLAADDATFRFLGPPGHRHWPPGPPGARRPAQHGSGDLLGRLVDHIDGLQDLFLRVCAPSSGLVVGLIAVAAMFLVDPGGRRGGSPRWCSSVGVAVPIVRGGPAARRGARRGPGAG